MKIFGSIIFFLISFLPLLSAMTLEGKVLVSGSAPANDIIRVNSDPYCTDIHSPRLENPVTIVAEDGGLRNAFVYLKEGVKEISLELPLKEVVLDQINCMFEPRVLGLQVGQDLRIESHDQTIHNVRGKTISGKGFNLGFPKPGKVITKTFDDEEVMLELRDDVHGWKRAYVGILSHPYYDVTGSDGRFKIENIPAGEYVLEVWHERLGLLEKEITVNEATEKLILEYGI